MVRNKQTSTFIAISLMLLVAATLQSAAVKEPEGPREPKVLNVEKSKKSVQPKKNDSKGAKLKIVLANKAILEGTIKIPSGQITVSHQKMGLNFRKKISLSEVSHLHILEWKPSRKVQRGPNLFRYYFYPNKWKIKSGKGVEYSYTGNIPAFNRIEISTDDGQAVLFTYFIDYWESNGEKTGHWHNTKEKDFAYPSTHPLDKVIVKLELM